MFFAKTTQNLPNYYPTKFMHKIYTKYSQLIFPNIVYKNLTQNLPKYYLCRICVNFAKIL